MAPGVQLEIPAGVNLDASIMHSEVNGLDVVAGGSLSGDKSDTALTKLPSSDNLNMAVDGSSSAANGLTLAVKQVSPVIDELAPVVNGVGAPVNGLTQMVNGALVESAATAADDHMATAGHHPAAAADHMAAAADHTAAAADPMAAAADHTAAAADHMAAAADPTAAAADHTVAAADHTAAAADHTAAAADHSAAAADHTVAAADHTQAAGDHTAAAGDHMAAAADHTAAAADPTVAAGDGTATADDRTAAAAGDRTAAAAGDRTAAADDPSAAAGDGTAAGHDDIAAAAADFDEPMWGDAMEDVDTLEFIDLPDMFHDAEVEEEHDRVDDYELLDVGPVDLRLVNFKNIWSPKRMLLRDKLAFLIGSTELWVCAYWMGHSPSSFYQFYIIEALVLFAVRWVVYSRRKWHYYMFDFCYYANMLLVTHVLLFPSSRLLNRAMFAYSTGPLAWSIPAFRNSLVYHDLDKVTSVFLHFVPTCVSWTLRWHPDPQRFHLFDSCEGKSKDDCSRILASENQPATFFEVVLVPLGPYILWAVLYYLKIFVISAKRIQQRKYQTLFDYITTAKKGVFAQITRKVPLSLRPLVYFALHLVFCVFTFMLSLLFWHNFYLHSGFMIGVACMSIWHGGNYYFEVFAKKYVSSLQAQHAAEEDIWTPRKKKSD